MISRGWHLDHKYAPPPAYSRFSFENKEGGSFYFYAFRLRLGLPRRVRISAPQVLEKVRLKIIIVSLSDTLKSLVDKFFLAPQG